MENFNISKIYIEDELNFNLISNIAENYIANIGNLLDLKVLQKPDIFESYNSNLSYIPFYNKLNFYTPSLYL